MLDTLSPDETLHLFSFFSSKELRYLRTVNKNINQFSHHPILWKHLLKREFDISDIKDFENTHIQKSKIASVYDQFYSPYFRYINAQDIVKKFLASLLEKDDSALTTEKKADLEVEKLDIEWCLNNFNARIPFDNITNDFNELVKRYPYLNLVKQSKTPTDSLRLFKEFINKKKSLFWLPLVSSDIQVINELLMLGEDVNVEIRNFNCVYFMYGSVTPLFVTLCNYLKTDGEPSKKFKELIHLLLKYGANPDAIIAGYDYVNRKPLVLSIREFCSSQLQEYNEEDFSMIPVEILQFIIDYPSPPVVSRRP